MSLKRKFSRLVLLLLIVILVKTIVWSLLVPLWHFPDEQAHFGHIAYFAEGGSLPFGRQKDLTEEIAISEQILGTFRDEQGNNKFTYHPEYRIDYSDNMIGPQEQEIKNLPLKTRTNFVAKESAYYPRFFYQLSGIIYKLFYQSNIFVRVFAIRLFWIMAHLLTIWFVFGIAQLVFPKQPALVIISTTIMAFLPMLSFVSAGITSDNLHNLLFTAVIYFSLKLHQSFNFKNLLLLAFCLVLGFISKQQFVIAFIIVAPIFISLLIKNPKSIFKLFVSGLLALLLGIILAPEYFQDLVNVIIVNGQIPFFESKPTSQQVRPDYTLINHLVFSINHTIKEVLPWYWGVFNWLGVVLPRWVNRVLMRLLGMALIGLIIKLVSIIKSKVAMTKNWPLFYLIWTALVYFLVLFFWDFNHVRNNGFSFGMQGRYYFPVISAHMILLTLGYQQIIALFSRRLSRYLLLLLPIWFFVLQIIGLKTVAAAYYDLSSYQTFIIQASQYKPFFAKGMWLSSALIIYFLTSLYLIYQLTRFILKHEK